MSCPVCRSAAVGIYRTTRHATCVERYYACPSCHHRWVALEQNLTLHSRPVRGLPSHNHHQSDLFGHET